MQNIQFRQIYKDDPGLYQSLLPLWKDYFNEIDERKWDADLEEEVILDLKRRVKIQGNRKEMHFELFYCDDALIGFANFAINTGTHYGLLEEGYGMVAEFYIIPANRRKGYGKLFYGHVERTLICDGAKYIYLTPDLITGVPFWTAMGFSDSGKTDPDNKLPIYIKKLTVE